MTEHYPPKESNKVTSQENTPQRKRNEKKTSRNCNRKYRLGTIDSKTVAESWGKGGRGLNLGCVQLTETFPVTRKQKQTFYSVVTAFGGR